MIRFQHRFEIDRSPGEVFAALTDIERIPEWQHSVVEVTKQTLGPVRAGTSFVQTVRMMGRRRGSVSVAAYVPGELVAFEGDTGFADYYCAFELTPHGGGGTTLVGRTEFRLHGLWKLLRPLIAAAVRRESGQEIATLKRLVEAPGRGTQPARAH